MTCPQQHLSVLCRRRSMSSWRRLPCPAIWLLSVMLALPPALPAQPDTVDTRLQDIVRRHIESPWPSPDAADDGARCWGLSAYALSALYLNEDLDTANRYISILHDRYNVPDDVSMDFDSYFKLNLLWRIYGDREMNARLTDAARAKIEDMMWRWLHARSTLQAARESVWRIADSENHDAMQKTGFLLCSQALSEAGPPYGPERQLQDGGTLAEHRTAWTAYWHSYFRERAVNGINCEIASPTYAKYSVGCYYNIRDLAASATLRALADSFISLYWADTACDWLSCGIRGGAETRCYKDTALTQGSGYGFAALLRAYGWHQSDDRGRTNPFILLAATSSYRVPPAITACASDRRRPPYLYTTRRFGLGGEWSQERVYTVAFDNGDSHLRRDSYVTAEYVLGGLTLDPQRDYIQLIDQNRAMGVFFASGPDDRIVIHGRGRPEAPTKSLRDINGICRPNCLIAVRTHDATHSTGMQVFVSAGPLWDRRVEDHGWLFTTTGSAHCAIRPAAGGYATVETAGGHLLVNNEVWAPILVQTGLSADYASPAAFRDSVLANALSYDGQRLSYTTEAGERLEVWQGRVPRVPTVNGVPLNLNPDKVYDSPYLALSHGERTATFRYPGYPALSFDFTNSGDEQ